MADEAEEELTGAQIQEAEEQHAIDHARYQVSQSNPDNPECVFDYELVAALLRVIDRAKLPAGAKIERAEQPPYLSDELVEQIAVLHNGGKWPDDYKESHRQHWRGQAVKIIELVKQYLDNPMYVVTVGGRASDEEIVREMFSVPGHIEVHTRLDGQTKPQEGV